MKEISKTNYKNLLESFLAFKRQLSDSIPNQNLMMEKLLESMSGEGKDESIELSCTLTTGSVINAVKDINQWTLTYYQDKDSPGEITVIPLENINPDVMINGYNCQLSALLTDINQAEQFNEVCYNINAAVLNYGAISYANITQIANDTLKGTKNEGVSELLLTLSSLNVSEITGAMWSQVVYNLSKSVQESAENDTLVLNTNRYGIQTFVGTVFLQAVGSFTQIVGLLLTKINVVIGVLVSVVGTIINTVINTTVPSTAKLNFDSSNFLLDIPLIASTQTMAVGESLEGLGLNSDNSAALCLSTPGLKNFLWRRPSDTGGRSTIYCNSFVSLDIDPDQLSSLLNQYAMEYQGASGGLGYRVDIRKLFTSELLNSEDYALTYTKALSHAGDDRYWAKACAVNIAMALLQFTQAFHSDTSVFNVYSQRTNWDTNQASDWENNTSEAVRFFLCRTFTASHSADFDWTNCWADISACLNYMIQKGFNMPLTITATTSESYDGKQCGLSGGLFAINLLYFGYPPSLYFDNTTPQLTGCSSYYDVGLPTTFFLSLPKYTNTALLDSVLTIGAIAAVGGLAYGVVGGRYKQFSSRKMQENLSNLTALRKKYEQTGLKSDYDNLYSQSKIYNLKAKLFGWGSYDLANNWVNYDQGSSSSTSSSNSNLNEILKLIK